MTNKELFGSLPFANRMVLRLGVAFHRKLLDVHRLRRVIPFFITASLIFGALTPLLNWRFNLSATTVGISFWFIGVPFVVGTVLLLSVNSLMKNAQIKRDSLIFASTLCFFAFLLVFGVGLLANGMSGRLVSVEDAWTFASSFAFAVGFASLYLITEKFRASVIYSVLLFLPLYASPFLPFDAVFFHVSNMKFYLARSILLGALLSFDITVILAVIDSIVKSDLGVGGMEMMNSLLSFLGGKRDALETSFTSMGRNVETYVGLVAFRTKKEKILFISPSIHPGPFAGVGGADMSTRFARALDGWAVFNFHGPATHDLDPASGSEVDKVAATIRDSLDGFKFSSRHVAPLFRASEGNMAVASQYFGMPFMVSYRVNEICEDIDASVGAAIIEDGAILVDAHNRLSPAASGEFWKNNLYSTKKHYFDDVLDYGKKTCFDLFSVHAKIMPRYNRPSGAGKFLAGSASVSFRNEGIGPEGIKAAVVRVGRQKVAYILVDGNNMFTGLREEVASAVGGIVDEVIVATTDSHAVNGIMGGLNPVGERMTEAEKKRFLNTCRSLVEEAVGNLRPAACASQILRIQDLCVLGPGKTAEIMSAVRAIAALSKALIPVTVVTLFMLSLIVLVST